MKGKSLEKTFGIRIPIDEHKEYYVETLLKSKSYEKLENDIKLFEDFENSLIDDETEKSIRYKLMEYSVSHFKEIFSDKINKWCPIHDFILEKNEFRPEHGKTYISFDVKQANWTVIKYFLGLKDYPSWEEYTETKLGFPKVFSNSKPLRQAILGQVVNPKKYTRMQEYLTYIHLDRVKSILPNYKIAFINSEEICLEIEFGDIDTISLLNSVKFETPMKVDIYRVDIHENFGDRVVVKSHYTQSFDFLYKDMYAVNGNRFYLHFKTLILEEEIDDRDLLFRLENKIFKYCGENYKDFKEYDFVKKYMKPLSIIDNSFYLNDKKLYTIEKTLIDNLLVFDHINKFEVLIGIYGDDVLKTIEKYHYDKISKFINC